MATRTSKLGLTRSKYGAKPRAARDEELMKLRGKEGMALKSKTAFEEVVQIAKRYKPKKAPKS